MTDYERTTTRETTTADPAPPAYPAEPLAPPPVQATAVRTTERAYAPAGPSGLTTTARVITFLFGILQAALVLRIILLLLVANQDNAVVSLILGVTDPFVEPFRGMFAIDRVSAGDSRLDLAALVALVGWTLVEALILAGLRIFSRRPAEVA
ncbi:MAG: YggT family protein [Candidatus Limnocylindrales bacterium]